MITGCEEHKDACDHCFASRQRSESVQHAVHAEGKNQLCNSDDEIRTGEIASKECMHKRPERGKEHSAVSNVRERRHPQAHVVQESPIVTVQDGEILEEEEGEGEQGVEEEDRRVGGEMYA